MYIIRCKTGLGEGEVVQWGSSTVTTSVVYIQVVLTISCLVSGRVLMVNLELWIIWAGVMLSKETSHKLLTVGWTR